MTLEEAFARRPHGEAPVSRHELEHRDFRIASPLGPSQPLLQEIHREEPVLLVW